MRIPDFCICSNCTADQRLCFRYTGSKIPLLLISKVSRFQPASEAVQAGLCRTWSETPKTGSLASRLNATARTRFSVTQGPSVHIKLAIVVTAGKLQGKKLLDVGSGPIYPVIAAVNWFEEIYLSDKWSNNLEYLEKWYRGESQHMKHIMECFARKDTTGLVCDLLSTCRFAVL